MSAYQFGYVTEDGKFYRRTVEAETLEAAVEMQQGERPNCEIVSVVQLGYIG